MTGKHWAERGAKDHKMGIELCSPEAQLSVHKPPLAPTLIYFLIIKALREGRFTTCNVACM